MKFHNFAEISSFEYFRKKSIRMLFEGHMCNYFLIRGASEKSWGREVGTRASAEVAHSPCVPSHTPKPSKVQTLSTTQERATAYSRRDAASDAHAHGGAGARDAPGRWTQHRADPKGALSFPPPSRFLIGFACLLGGFWGLVPG